MLIPVESRDAMGRTRPTTDLTTNPARTEHLACRAEKSHPRKICELGIMESAQLKVLVPPRNCLPLITPCHAVCSTLRVTVPQVEPEPFDLVSTDVSQLTSNLDSINCLSPWHSEPASLTVNVLENSTQCK